MDIKSKILFYCLAFLITISISASYYRYVILHDYIVEAQVDCDPTLENCFVWQCNQDEEKCTGNPEEDTWYYKFIYRNAKNIPSCDPTVDSCNALVCPDEGEDQCKYVTCTDEALINHHLINKCSDPSQFQESYDVGTEKDIDSTQPGDTSIVENTEKRVFR